MQAGDVALGNRSSLFAACLKCSLAACPTTTGTLFSPTRKRRALVASEPGCASVIRPLLTPISTCTASERWCLWLKDVPPRNRSRHCPGQAARRSVCGPIGWRAAAPPRRSLPSYPMLFGEIRQPTSRFVLFPRHSSESRRYIPISYFGPKFVPSDRCLFLESATLYHFGVLSSAMHMAWVRQVCGRLKSDFRYSSKLVYNNYPWPESPSEKQRPPLRRRRKPCSTPAKNTYSGVRRWPTFTTRLQCRLDQQGPMPLWTARWTAPIAGSHSHLTGNGSSFSFPYTTN